MHCKKATGEDMAAAKDARRKYYPRGRAPGQSGWRFAVRPQVWIAYAATALLPPTGRRPHTWWVVEDNGKVVGYLVTGGQGALQRALTIGAEMGHGYGKALFDHYRKTLTPGTKITARALNDEVLQLYVSWGARVTRGREVYWIV